jgi:hypothetical protein
MPYPRALYLVIFVLIATIIGFWPSYFASLGDATFAFHVHGITASAWILLLGFQVWSIQNRRRPLHRKVGLLSLILFPILTASLVMIANVSAAGIREGEAFYLQLGPVFGYATAVALFAFLVLFAQALRNRHNVYLHAGYMLSTLLLLWEPAASRLLMRFVPSMAINGPADYYKITDAIALGIAMALPLAVYWYVRDTKHGTPFLIITIFLTLQIAGSYWLADTELWREWFNVYAQLPSAMTVSIGILLGVVATWIGWLRPCQRPGVVFAD